MSGLVLLFYLLLLPVPEPEATGIRIEEGSIVFREDKVTFTGLAVDDSALHREVTAELWDEKGERVSATGDAYTFTVAGESHLFEIGATTDALQVGRRIGLNLTTAPGQKACFKKTVVQVGVPALSRLGLFALIVLLAGLGLMQQRT